MTTKRRFRVEHFFGAVPVPVSEHGYYLDGVGACHPRLAAMTELDHAQICRAVCWMADEPGVTAVELTADGSWRVSWRQS